jgi:WD40 repeat protein
VILHLDASFSPDGKTIASASSDTTIKLWQWDGTLIATLNAHTDTVHSVSFSSDSKWLVSTGCRSTCFAMGCVRYEFAGFAREGMQSDPRLFANSIKNFKKIM